jgi:hypothetical protein
MMNTTKTEIEKRIAKYARTQAKRIESIRRCNPELAKEWEAEAIAEVDRMRAAG